MSNQNDLTAVHHALKDIDHQLKKNSSRMSWILILVIVSLGITMISFVIAIAK